MSNLLLILLLLVSNAGNDTCYQKQHLYIHHAKGVDSLHIGGLMMQIKHIKDDKERIGRYDELNRLMKLKPCGR